MQLTILGSGCCVPSLRRSSPGYLLTVKEKHFLLDCGPGTMRSLTKMGVDIADLSGIFLSHFHLDHCGELCPLIFSLKYAGFEKKSNLLIAGPPGLTDFFQKLEKIYQGWITPESFSLKTVENVSVIEELSNFPISSEKMKHGESAVGYRFEGKSGGTLAYTGDTDYCPEVIELSRNADVCLCECSFPDDRKVKGHLTPSLAGKVAEEAGVKRLILTHFYPPCDEADVVEGAAKFFPGEIIRAEDMMTINI